MTGPTPPPAASPAQPAADPAVYLRNLALLWRWDPELAMRVDAVADQARVPVEPTRSGAWTAALAAPDGAKTYLHSRYDPAAEAQKLVDAVDIEGCYCYLVGGAGLGYLLPALRRRILSEAIIILTEPNLELLASAFAHVDLTDVLADGKLIILTDLDKAALHQRLAAHTALIMLGTKIVSHPPSQRLAGDFHTQMRALITDFLAYSRMTLVTLVANSQITCRNIAYNLPRYVCTPPIDILRNRFAGLPAVIVSAGPSLRRNIDQLAQAKGRAVICAVQTTLKPLLERGIRPDFVTSLDFHEISGHFFEGVGDLADVHLIAEPKATWHVIDRYTGPVSMLHNAFAELLIGEDLARRGGLLAGATVAHLAFYLARYLGCDPIVFVGQDLAFTGHVLYLPGVEAHRAWRSEMNRFSTLETKEWERIVRHRAILRQVAGNDGRRLYTDDLLFTYLEQFEKDIAATGVRVINATEGGARIRGTEVMTLAEVLQRFCTRPIPPDLFAYRTAAIWNDRRRLPQLREEIVARLNEVTELAEVCARMLDLLKQLQDLTDQPDKFNRLILRVDELRAKVNQAHRAYRIINATTQLAELRRFSADRRLSAAREEGSQRARLQLERDIEFVTAMGEAAHKTTEILTETLARIDRY